MNDSFETPQGENETPPADVISVVPARSQFRRFLAANPNYFGTMPDLGPALGLDLPMIEAIAGNTTYEQLACVSFSPERDRLEATISVKQAVGYGGGLCLRGTHEYVRFYVEQGGGWVDAGVAAAPVHDLPIALDCGKNSDHPLYPVTGVDFAPLRSWCFFPKLPRVRAILSWEVPPPPNQPNWVPVWGNVAEATIQVKARRLVIFDLLDQLPKEVVEIIPDLEKVEPQIPIGPDPDPGPITVLSLSEVAEISNKAQVPAHRFALPHVAAASANLVDGSGQVLAQNAVQAKLAGIDLSEIFKILDGAGGNTEYEQLRCLGLDEGKQALVATFVVKKPNGFGGGPCTSGSTEYVAFWADWDDVCQPTYLGTVKVTVHDYPAVKGGIQYAAILPVNLGAVRKPCQKASISRVRAVLSWGTAPSTTDPDALPYWGNRLDRHVQVSPGTPYDGHAHFTIVGGVAAADVNLVSGLTDPGAVLAETGTVLAPSGWAFSDLVVLHGPLDPALVGTTYRLEATNVDSGATLVLKDPFSATGSDGVHHTITPDPMTGNVAWPTWGHNTTGVLGNFAPGGNDRWDVELKVGPAFGTADTARVRIDSILRTTIEPGDSVNAGSLVVNTGGACFVDKTVPLTGTFVARDLHFGSWSISVHGGPGSPIVVPPPITGGLLPSSQTPVGGTAFSLNIGSLDSCGYVVRLAITDRVIVSSTSLGRTNWIERGICVR